MAGRMRSDIFRLVHGISRPGTLIRLVLGRFRLPDQRHKHPSPRLTCKQRAHDPFIIVDRRRLSMPRASDSRLFPMRVVRLARQRRAVSGTACSTQNHTFVRCQFRTSSPTAGDRMHPQLPQHCASHVIALHSSRRRHGWGCSHRQAANSTVKIMYMATLIESLAVVTSGPELMAGSIPIRPP